MACSSECSLLTAHCLLLIALPLVEASCYAALCEAAIGHQFGYAAAGGAEAAVGEGGIGAHADVLVAGEVLGQGLFGALLAEGVAYDAVTFEGE